MSRQYFLSTKNESVVDIEDAFTLEELFDFAASLAGQKPNNYQECAKILDNNGYEILTAN